MSKISLIQISITLMCVLSYVKLSLGHILIGNGDVFKTYRPITKFDKIIIGNYNQSNLIVTTTIEVNVYLDKTKYSQLSVETDQNLQKYFRVDSDGEYLSVSINSANSEDNELNLTNTSEINVFNATAIKIDIITDRPISQIDKLILSNTNFTLLTFNYQHEKSSSNSKELTLNVFCDANTVLNGLDTIESLIINADETICSNPSFDELNVHILGKANNIQLSKIKGKANIITSTN